MSNRPQVEISDMTQLSPAPVVSVAMVTYNHESWIRNAIEGVLMQEAPFDYELVIGEDCSSDATRSIVLDYQRRFPSLIRVICSERNVGPAANHGRVIDAARGEFLAFCEGDDYWCNPRKLAAQVALLQADPGAGAAHSDWIRARNDGANSWILDLRSVHHRMRRKYLEGDLFPVFYFAKVLRTCTLMLRRSALQAYQGDRISTPAYRFGDTVIASYVTSRWRVAYWPEVSAVYRESPGSLLRSGLQSKIAFLKSCLAFDDDARQYFADRSDYPQAYRLEIGLGLFLWAVKARDRGAAVLALRDLRAHFGVRGFFVACWRALSIRLPTLRRRGDAGAASAAAWR
ncbi:glycosyltransferase [Luteimonas sp. MC1825]|uniref:glycosyltransferase family 2 protein n=1 Tax=Luteimonas sp. MC1825 TaxID=2761107 RepID=UPI0016110C24|nr:glycosyltransferase [Luteimonas sp. MC1825]MBB6600005.1 glycosyltransferase [Luteimonas sp. MC1825]QOC87708.1 glycosyltransferase [Luteimonas sp. MC1825]